MAAMDLEELRGLPLFDGLDDAQLGELAPRPARSRPSPRARSLFSEGQPADAVVGAPRGVVTLPRRVGTRGDRAGR